MDDKKLQESLASEQEVSGQKTENAEQTKPEGSGIFTTDGKELPKIDGGYDISGPGGTLGDNEFE